MKKDLIILLTIITLLPFSSCGQNDTNNETIINEKKYDTNVGPDYETKTNSGEKIQFRTEKKERMSYKDNFVSFQNKRDLIISSCAVIGSMIVYGLACGGCRLPCVRAILCRQLRHFNWFSKRQRLRPWNK